MSEDTNNKSDDIVADLIGNSPALSSEKGKSGPPDIKDVSFRWLAGTIMTGVTSITLMGGALIAALDGQNEFARPTTEIAENVTEEQATANTSTATYTGKQDRPLPVTQSLADRNVLRLSTLTRTNEGNRVRTRPFGYMQADLARRSGDPTYNIPAFDAVTIFSGSSKFREKGDDNVLYESQVEDEIELRDVDFPFASAEGQAARGFSDDEIEANLRRQLPVLRASLGDGTILAKAGAIAYVDPARFEGRGLPKTNAPFDELVVIKPENVLDIEKTSERARLKLDPKGQFLTIRKPQTIADFINETFDLETEADELIASLREALGDNGLSAGHRLRLHYAGGPNRRVPDIVSVYDEDTHVATVARADDDTFVKTDEPPTLRNKVQQQKRPPLVQNQPSTYRSIYNAALKEGIPRPLVKELIRIYSFDVDFRRATRRADNMNVFYSLDPDSEQATDDSEILYTSLTLDGVERKYYRFKTTDDGVVDYYDENGRSAKKFLMRQPVPRARFRSSFGWRRHPILRTRRLHKGVDWSAPRGTPIFAAGNGIIEDAKWFSGYGRWIKIRHANGYKTGYAHMSRFAKGMKPGVRVRQGQIIGYVGSTGLSTGNHLHYEVIVNGRHVDPMRIRLPRGRVLSGEQLANFERERDRIDQLLTKPEDEESVDFAFNTTQ